MADTLQQLLRERAEDDRPAVRRDERVWTWREHVAEASELAAAVLARLDPDRPPHVGVRLGNTPEMLTAMAAAALGGFVLVGLNTTRTEAQLAGDAERTHCQLVLDPDTRLEPAGPLVARDVRPEDTFMLIFTSGTSGEPKAVQVPHVFPVLSGGVLAERFAITADDVCYVSMPLFHSNAVVAGWAVALMAGACVVPARFSASGLVDDVRRHGATYLNYVGKPLAYVLATPERPDDADNPLRVAFGNEASERDIAAFSRRFDCRVVDGFGSTESAIVVTRPPETPSGSIGRGLDGVAVYDPVTVTECAVAQLSPEGVLLNADEAVGELVNTHGAGMFQGYYDDPAATAERLRHGIFWSGDLAYRDADGWVYLAGRTADWLRVDGENLATAPVERVLQRHPDVSQVAVYGVPAADGVGQEVMAAVVLTAPFDPDAWTAFVVAQPDLPRVARPRFVRVCEALPATATHKVLKRELIAEGVTAGDGTVWEASRPDA